MQSLRTPKTGGIAHCAPSTSALSACSRARALQLLRRRFVVRLGVNHGSEFPAAVAAVAVQIPRPVLLCSFSLPSRLAKELLQVDVWMDRSVSTDAYGIAVQSKHPSHYCGLLPGARLAEHFTQRFARKQHPPLFRGFLKSCSLRFRGSFVLRRGALCGLGILATASEVPRRRRERLAAAAAPCLGALPRPQSEEEMHSLSFWALSPSSAPNVHL